VTDDGRVIGIWDLGEKDKPPTIRVTPLTSWSATIWQDVEAPAEKIKAFVEAPNVIIERFDRVVDLTSARKNRHLYR